MLQKSKDYWKKKAEVEYEYAKAEEQNFQQMIENQNAWKKRLEESSWLLQGAIQDANNDGNELKALNDQTLLQTIDDKNKKKHKYDLKEVNLEEILSPNQKKGSSFSPQKSPDWKGRKKVRWGEAMSSYVETMSPLRLTRDKKTPDELRKEEEARRRLQSDERKHRENFLKESIDRIHVLERVKETLEHPRMPKHHRPARLMKGYITPIPLTDEEKLQNLRPCDRDIHAIQPIIEELKSWDEVIHEDNATRMLTIPGRYHHYLGADRLYPLNKFPSTTEVLLPLNHTSDMIPENVLLKNVPKPIEKTMIDPNITRAIHQQKHLRIKRAIFDLARAPVKHYPVRGEQHIPMGSEASSLGSVRVNHQYAYRQRDFPDDNSVYRSPHPNVVFYENEAQKAHLQQVEAELLAKQRENDYDSVAANTGVHYNLLRRPSVDGFSTNNSLQNNSRFPSSVHQSSQSIQPSVSLQENESQNAVRSNFVAEDSIRTEPGIPVKLIRLRKARSLSNVHMKNDLHFISLEQKEELEEKKKQQKIAQIVLEETKKQILINQKY